MNIRFLWQAVLIYKSLIGIQYLFVASLHLSITDAFILTLSYISIQLMNHHPPAKYQIQSQSSPTDSQCIQQAPSHTRNVNSSKFLKRKPDHTKLLGSPSSKKSRESSINHRIPNSPQPDESQSLSQSVQSRFITTKKVAKEKSESGDSALLETAKSQNNLFLRKRELGVAINRVYDEASKLTRGSFLSTLSKQDSKQLSSKNEGVSQIQDYNHFGNTQRKVSKKTRTEFFNVQELGLDSQASNLMGKDQSEDPSTQEHGEMSYEQRRLMDECESLGRKNRWLEEQAEAYAQREYLLITEKKHLQDLLREKEITIEVLQKERKQWQPTQRQKEEVAAIASMLARQEQRYRNLKEENDYMQVQLISKNQELIALYNQHAQQQSKSKRQRQHFINRLDKMKLEIDKLRHAKMYENEQVMAVDKWKDKAFRQQQQLKYLQVQNQCLLISKEELVKCESQNRKLRDQRDYFKLKVMQNIKRNKRLHQLSRSENSSILFELSETSIDRK